MASSRLIRAFSLIELLTVIAIVAILLAIIVPTVGEARDSANRAATKAQFNQWAAAMELYRQEYGFYPDIAPNGLIDTDRFAAELTGRTLTGTSVQGNENWGNTKGLGFYALMAGDLDESGNDLVDAFGNAEIAMRRDTNRDGRINGSDTRSWVGVDGAEASSLNPTSLPEAVPINGVRAGVVFYSAGRGRDETDLVLSWK
ncbi:MAG: prepilin-type N-terminal cleavage/methylation domain-containing protein [Opitutaceae bacterium]|nr:prepilin-type N-terminal cleavage/methylation domain-containing protein [Opitutaceae bacterium]